MPDTIEQENLTETEVISLLNDEVSPSTTPSRKGYADYVKDAEDEAATSDTDDDAGANDDKDTPDESKIPEKFKGKTAAEIAASYAQLESEYGRRNTEIGSLRKLTDQLLELKTDNTESKAPERKKLEVDDLLSNPGDAIDDAVSNSPRLKALEDKLASEDLAKSKSAFEQKHPTWETTMASDEFASWILESPLRTRLFKESNANYDYATGSELLELYDAVKGTAITEAKDQRNTTARKSAKQAVTESGGNQDSKPKKMYRREELIQLKLRNPAKYEAMKDDIMKAYADKRVI